MLEMRLKALSIYLWIILLATNVLPYKKVKVFVLSPPKLVMENVTKAVVMDFYGDYGDLFAERLVTQLLKPDRGIYDVKNGFFKGLREGKTLQEGTFTNIYDVFERNRLYQIIREQNLALGGIVDDYRAVEIGKLAGAQAIITGNVSFTHDTKDGTVEKSSKSGTRYVAARYREVSVTYQLKVIDVETGQILGSIERQVGREDQKYDKEIDNIMDIDAAVNECVSDLSYDAANYLTPHYVLAEFELQKIKTKKLKEQADEAAKKAENLDIDGSYVIYQQLIEQDSYNHKLLYNLGVLNEVVGNFKAAQEFYEQAFQLKNKEKDYQKAVERNAKNVEFAEVLTGLGIEIRQHNFEFSAEEAAMAMADWIELKGKDSERISIYKTPTEGAKIIAKVPGGSTFAVIQQENQWYLIKLLGGKQGYVHAKRVR